MACRRLQKVTGGSPWKAPPVVLRGPMKERSTACLVHGSIDVNTWLRSPPSVDGARPPSCPSCGAAGRRLGAPIGMVGHGVRRRQVRGPTRFGEAPSVQIVIARRYRCRVCSRAVTVLPRGVIPGRQFHAAAIAFACLLLGLGRLALTAVRRRVAPGTTYEDGWPALRRWLRAIQTGRLLAFVRPWPVGLALAKCAERVATTVMAFAPYAVESAEERLFRGIALAA